MEEQKMSEILENILSKLEAIEQVMQNTLKNMQESNKKVENSAESDDV